MINVKSVRDLVLTSIPRASFLSPSLHRHFDFDCDRRSASGHCHSKAFIVLAFVDEDIIEDTGVGRNAGVDRVDEIEAFVGIVTCDGVLN